MYIRVQQVQDTILAINFASLRRASQKRSPFLIRFLNPYIQHYTLIRKPVIIKK